MSIKSELDKMAIKLLKDANDGDASIETKIDVFKVVSAYHLGTQRVTKGRDSEDEAKTSFSDILTRVNGASTKGGNA